MTLALPKLAWTPSPNTSSRGGSRVRLIVIHDCEGSFAGSVSWFAQARSQVSAHYVLSEDGTQARQMVAQANKAWHACNANPFSIGIEAAGFAAKGLGQPEWQALANVTAFLLRGNGIPCVAATAANGWTGFCQHRDLGAMGGGHNDVTALTPVWAAFVGMVERAYAQPMPDSWSAGFRPTPAPPAPPGWKPSNTIRHDLAGPPSLEWVQASLNRLGIPHTPLIVDGMDGPQTRHAVEQFQQAHHLWIDGAAGRDTVVAIEKELMT